MFVMKSTNNPSGTDWMEQFQLWDMPIKCFLTKNTKFYHRSGQGKIRIKRNVPRSLLQWTWQMQDVKLKPIIQPVFKKKKECAIRIVKSDRRGIKDSNK